MHVRQATQPDNSRGRHVARDGEVGQFVRLAPNDKVQKTTTGADADV
jgi:hypothetical protein